MDSTNAPVATEEKPVEEKKPDFNWVTATEADIDAVFDILLPGFDKEDFSQKGLIKRVGKKARGRSPQEIITSHNEKIEKKKQDIPAEYLALSVDEVQDCLERLGSSIKITERYSEAEMWKAYRLLSGKAKKQALTIDAIRKLEKKIAGRRGRFSIIVTPLTNTTAPTGFPEAVSIFLQKCAAGDPDAQIGRSQGVRPMAVAKLPNILGTNVLYISLGKEWKLPKEMLNTKPETASE